MFGAIHPGATAVDVGDLTSPYLLLLLNLSSWGMYVLYYSNSTVPTLPNR